MERHSRFAQLVQVDGKGTGSVVRAVTLEVARLPEGLIKTLAWDRGMELAQHKVFSMTPDVVDVFFCDPRSPWQRGTNENTNGLIRQYLPKGMDLSTCSQDDLDQIAIRLNTRPRKTLGYETPASRPLQAVAATGWTQGGFLCDVALHRQPGHLRLQPRNPRLRDGNTLPTLSCHACRAHTATACPDDE